MNPINTVDSCRVGNGQKCSVIGIIQTPVRLVDRVRIIDVLVVPEIPHLLVLGIDFWRSVDVIPDLNSDVWHFRANPEPSSVQSIQTESNLTPKQRQRLEDLVNSKMELIGKNIGYTTLIEHEIITEYAPIKQRYYLVSPIKQKIIDDELSKMLAEGIVEPSQSAWSSPILLVPKKDGGYRFCVDYRRLNAVTKKDAYPLPYVSATLDRLRDARYLSSLDIKSAYWQIPVKESSRELTAFTVPRRGLFHFKRMPFGLTNTPATC